MAKEIHSIRKLADAVHRSHTAVRRWLKHADWPWPSIPPWYVADVSRMIAWAKENLSEDPSQSYSHRPESDLPPPGQFKITAANLLEDDALLKPVRDWIGEKLWASMTQADLAAMASRMNFGTCAAMLATVEADGEKGLPSLASREFWEHLFEKNPEKILENWNRAVTIFADGNLRGKPGFDEWATLRKSQID